MKFWSPVCLLPLLKNFGVWRSQWRVFRLLKQNIAFGEGEQAKKRSLGPPAVLSVVELRYAKALSIDSSRRDLSRTGLRSKKYIQEVPKLNHVGHEAHQPPARKSR